MKSFPRSIFSCLLLVLVLHISSCIATDSVLQLNDDVLGLIVFKSELHDPNSSLSSWNEDDDTPCSWRFVKCDPKNGLVSELSLEGLGLSGKIGRGLEKLENLRVLSIARNNFSGKLGPELSRLGRLRSLNLSYNRFTGSIPAGYGAMRSIRTLDFSENLLSGPLPDHLFENCTTIRSVSAGGNLFTGSLPATLQKCVVLGSLNVSGNRLSGSPEFAGGLWMLKRLRMLDLSSNGFSGRIPVGLWGLHNLKELYLQNNQFSGLLPFDAGLCIHLNRMDLSGNLFTGRIPNSFQRLSSLSYINLSKNKLNGEVPTWIGSLSSLEYLDFSGNFMNGNLPSSLGDLKLLGHLYLSENRFSGEIPKTIVECTRLTELSLRDNDLSGNIPPGLFELGLETIDLSSNDFSGLIPPLSTRLFDSLRVLDLSNNNLTSKIPAEMSLCTNMNYLNLSWNNLQSWLPPEFGELKSLSQLDLRYTGLQGSIPSELFNASTLTVLQLDGNSLTGPIPKEIGNLSSLTYLSLSHNNLIGSIPMELSKLRKLMILNLAFNKLSGEIPEQLGSLDNLLVVNLSFNKLSGKLPRGRIFDDLDQSALEGNDGLCSPKLGQKCQLNVPKPLALDPGGFRNGDGNVGSETASQRFKHRKFLTVSAIIAICAAVVIAMGVVMVTLLNLKAQKTVELMQPSSESLSSTTGKSCPAMGKLVLFSSASDSRSEDWVNNAQSLLNKASEIGKGVFGTVYRASVTEGRVIAIKKLISSNIVQSQDDFDREVQILGKVRHPNLVSLKGYYWTPQLQLLISEFYANGSLHDRLHENSAPGVPPLSWPQRFKIALGTAKGLAHLHQSYRPPIIHYNVKPTNILLDENLNPKISDFGLARLLPKLDPHILSNRFQRSLGYAAPELACQSLRINEKCDIYGYGVLILELVTGRRPIEYGEDDVVILCDHVRSLIEQGKAMQCVDQTMKECPEEEVLPVLKLGLVCTSQIPSSRPSMAEVAQILQVIKTPVPERMEIF
ncbi:probably inactive leucine-rich repeat receptor-like protein kinase At3g28040 [Nymphaea colorata]|nr:probably inactive leucine-rich repeat receptor-like protein kinase At3g28040 [Nymphaea colorata]